MRDDLKVHIGRRLYEELTYEWVRGGFSGDPRRDALVFHGVRIVQDWGLKDDEWRVYSSSHAVAGYGVFPFTLGQMARILDDAKTRLEHLRLPPPSRATVAYDPDYDISHFRLDDDPPRRKRERKKVEKTVGDRYNGREDFGQF